MGSISGNVNTRPDSKEIRVLVTGFGVGYPDITPRFTPQSWSCSINVELPEASKNLSADCGFHQPFRAQFPINPSWEIASRLPPYVPTNVKDEGHHPHARPPINKTTPRIKIETYGAPVHVGYKAVRELVPVLLDDTKPDYILHIGMASGRSFYSCERRGHRDGYFMKDVDGKVLNDEHNKIQEGDDWVWHDCPGELLTSLPFDKMFRQWKEACPEVDTRISEDAGNYLCDFIYYTSLAHRHKHQQPNKTMFLHVPVDADPESVLKGVEITTELIRAMVECDLKTQANVGDNINTAEEKVDL